ncbi:MAG: type II toxin-antitoxin system HicA family toxin [Candidatus Delongbacteria bacterium]|nr:type II toxin-antitoxin system HicA family toxin [Candidatus Delongbacteria bacterium]
MSKLKVLSGKEICRILTAHGFFEVRQKGSHIAMQKKTPESTITVIVPDHKEVKIGTLMSIIRQSNISKSKFE